jgi:glyoxylase-like metal-dependent hydrolase (beta-lactamase superfamily II)
MTSLTQPIMLAPQDAAAEWRVLPAFIPVSGMGVLAANSFLLKGAETVLVDTGLAVLGDAMIDALEAEIDLEDLRWIWLSHTDADHIGNLDRILERAPNARVVTNFLGAGKMVMLGHDMSRLHVLDAGQALTLPDRVLHPIRPPYYDAPETHGFIDSASRVLFAADAFGALLPEPVDTVDAVDDGALRDGLVAWSTIDAPWLQVADRARLGATLAAVNRLAPSAILSGHLPHAGKGSARLTREVHAAWVAGGASGLDPMAIEAVTAALD